MEKFILGLAVGMAGGAILVANNCKLRQMIKKNQQELMQKAEEYIDEQLDKTSSGRDEKAAAQGGRTGRKPKENESLSGAAAEVRGARKPLKI